MTSLADLWVAAALNVDEDAEADTRIFAHSGVRQPVEEAPRDEEAPAHTPGLRDVPLLVVAQYGLLALHSTTHDQVFLSYLVT